MNKTDARRLRQAQRIADEVLRLLAEDVTVADDGADVVSALHGKASVFSFRLPEKCFEIHDWALGMVSLSVNLYFASLARHAYKEGTEGGQWDVMFVRKRDLAILCAKEINGLFPSRVRERERKDKTDLWVSSYRNPGLSDDARNSLVRTALATYPDFDLSLLAVEGLQ